MEQNNSALTGGCQCGAVRFMIARTAASTLCHCRMCQKAFGALYAPMVASYGLKWTRGAPKYFQSSNMGRRGFCGECGTPLSYETLDRSDEEEIEVAVGAFDHPGLVKPTLQINPNDKYDFTDEMCSLPFRTGKETREQEAFNATVVSYQHPDHDTATWPPEQGFLK